jgi:P63C domain
MENTQKTVAPLKMPGRSRSGKASAAKLTPEQRRERSKKASAIRWDNTIPIVTHGNEDRPLIIGSIKIPCYVLSNGKRVLVESSMASALGMGVTGGSRISRFSKNKIIESHMPPNIIALLETPIKFKLSKGGMANGYDANILVDLCESVLAARSAGNIAKTQEHIAVQCEIIMRGLARVGIIALVDEATGYQADRAKDELTTMLSIYIARELQPYIKTFPQDFFNSIANLKGIPLKDGMLKHVPWMGAVINNIIYDRIAPGAREELKKGIERYPCGQLKARLHQKLTPHKGKEKLIGLISSSMALMKTSGSWDDFMQKMDIVSPKFARVPSEDDIKDFLELENRKS